MNYPANMLIHLYEPPRTRPVYDIEPVVRTRPSTLARMRRIVTGLRPAGAPECADAHA